VGKPSGGARHTSLLAQCHLLTQGASLRALWSAATLVAGTAANESGKSPESYRASRGQMDPDECMSPSRLSLFLISTTSARRIGVDSRPREAPKRFPLYLCALMCALMCPP
jgi:hypothetical protein